MRRASKAAQFGQIIAVTTFLLLLATPSAFGHICDDTAIGSTIFSTKICSTSSVIYSQRVSAQAWGYGASGSATTWADWDWWSYTATASAASQSSGYNAYYWESFCDYTDEWDWDGTGTVVQGAINLGASE